VPKIPPDIRSAMEKLMKGMEKDLELVPLWQELEEAIRLGHPVNDILTRIDKVRRHRCPRKP
jgi:hypothetical protein